MTEKKKKNKFDFVRLPLEVIKSEKKKMIKKKVVKQSEGA